MKISNLARLALSLSLSTLALACGGSTPAANAPTAGVEEHHHDELGEAHKFEANLPPQVKDFHTTLAPLWHAPKGADRTAKTCAQASTLKDKATALDAASVPEKADAASWKAESKELVGASAALVTECGKAGQPDFEARFTEVHAHFHKLTEQIPH